MAKVGGPLMSLSASGTIAQTLTYGNWKGISYVRTRVIPANPRSSSQTQTREVFSYLQSLYKYFPSIAREPWIAATVGIPMTPENMLLSKNVSLIRTQTDLDLLVLSPGARGGSPPSAIVATPGAGSLSIAVTAPSIPAGWTITAAQAVAVLDQDPHDPIEATPVANEDLTAPYTVVLSGLTSSVVYQVGAWLKWLTPNGLAAYSIALRDQATPS